MTNLKPVLKWAGGKTKLLPTLLEEVPMRFNNYLEPFLGGGALLLALEPNHAWVGDTNSELINFYEMVKTQPEELIELVTEYFSNHSQKYYYQIRGWDRQEGFEELPPVERAARILYLNKHCFNGLWRVNSKGQFNVPYGRPSSQRKRMEVDEEGIRASSELLRRVDFFCQDYEKTIKLAKSGDFVYLDPPYQPVDQTSNFTGYTSAGFSWDEQVKLKVMTAWLDKTRVKFMLSNSNTPEVRNLYGETGYYTKVVKMPRAINCKGDRRGKVEELLIKNY